MSRCNPDFNILISNVLRYGVIISTAIILIGVLMILLGDRSTNFPTSLGQLVKTNYGRPTLSLEVLVNGLRYLDPISVIQLGILILLATPIARVIFSIFLFASEKDKIYVALTLFVLIVLLLSIFVVGPIEAS